MTYKTLIFDLDGTISDPFVGISRSVNYALESLDFEAVDPEAIRPMIGPPLTEIFEHLVDALSETQMQALIDKYRERYATIGYAENQIYAEIPAIISRLAAHGYRLGVCTAKRADYAQKIIEFFKLDLHFEFIDGGGIGVSKTEQLARIIEAGVNPATAVMVGDRAGDINAAKSNSVQSVGVLWGFGDEAELCSANPDYLVKSPQELQSIFL